MYKIFSEDGNTIAYTESVNYICVGESGSYKPTDAANAQGVAVNGTAYSLLGHDALEGAESVVGVAEFDGAALIAEQESIIDDLLIAELEG